MKVSIHPHAARQIIEHLRSLEIDEAEKALDQFVDVTIAAAYRGTVERERFHYWNGFCQGVCVAVFVASLGMMFR